MTFQILKFEISLLMNHSHHNGDESIAFIAIFFLNKQKPGLTPLLVPFGSFQLFSTIFLTESLT
jgi:hypothetical protein